MRRVQRDAGRRRTRDITDSGYTGMNIQYPDRDSRVAVKRKPGKSLTRQEKEYNRALSRIRIRVEHAIRRVKIFRIRGTGTGTLATSTPQFVISCVGWQT